MADQQQQQQQLQQQQFVQMQMVQQQQQQQPHANGGPSKQPRSANKQQSQQHLATSNPPSRVLHIRGLPPYTHESDLLAFFTAQPGIVLTRILILPNSNQAFIQLPSIEMAHALLQLQAQMGGNFVIKGNKSIILQFSNRQEIHTPTRDPNATGNANGNNPAAAANASSTATHAAPNGNSDSQHAANSILLVTVLNTRVPVTLDHIHQIFKPYGEVLRIITFHKNAVFKALVQLDSVESAVQARMLLEGKDIFQGCCHLRIGFSCLQELNVKTPGNNARDFTTASGASVPTNGATFVGGEGTAGYAQPAFQTQQQQQGLISTAQGTYATGYDTTGGQHYPGVSGMHVMQGHMHHPQSHAAPHSHSQSQPGCVVLVSNLPESVVCATLFTLFGVYGDVLRVKILYNKRDTALVQYVSPQSAYLASLHLNHLVLRGRQISVTPSKHPEVALAKTGGTLNSLEAEQAASGLTMDYAHSPIHRFKRTAGAASSVSSNGGGGGLGAHAKAIHPPSQVLHVSSLAEGVTEEELRALFSSKPSGSTDASTNGQGENEEKVSLSPPVVQFFTSAPRAAPGMAQAPVKPNRQAFLRFKSVADAVEALIDFHNYSLHNRYLRISFSGKEPAAVHPTHDGQPIHSPNSASAQQQQQQGQQQGQSAQPQSPHNNATPHSNSIHSPTEGQSTQ